MLQMKTFGPGYVDLSAKFSALQAFIGSGVIDGILAVGSGNLVLNKEGGSIFGIPVEYQNATTLSNLNLANTWLVCMDKEKKFLLIKGNMNYYTSDTENANVELGEISFITSHDGYSTLLSNLPKNEVLSPKAEPFGCIFNTGSASRMTNLVPINKNLPPLEKDRIRLDEFRIGRKHINYLYTGAITCPYGAYLTDGVNKFYCVGNGLFYQVTYTE